MQQDSIALEERSALLSRFPADRQLARMLKSGGADTAKGLCYASARLNRIN